VAVILTLVQTKQISMHKRNNTKNRVQIIHNTNTKNTVQIIHNTNKKTHCKLYITQ
jgi:hypothetical protein